MLETNRMLHSITFMNSKSHFNTPRDGDQEVKELERDYQSYLEEYESKKLQESKKNHEINKEREKSYILNDFS